MYNQGRRLRPHLGLLDRGRELAFEVEGLTGSGAVEQKIRGWQPRLVCPAWA
jgi:hypothetical protein